jgi:hypothetical protein
VSNGIAAPTWQEIASSLPSQTGNNGKFLTTNGTAASWATIKELGNGTATGQLMIWNNTASAWQVLSVGTDGQVLTLASGSPSWADATDALVDGTVNGQVLYWNSAGAAWTALTAGVAKTALISNGAAAAPSYRDIATAMLDGKGSGFPRWNDTTDAITIYTRLTASLIDSNLTTITDTFAAPVMLFAPAGINQVFIAKEMSYCLAQQLPTTGTQVAGMVLTLKSGTGLYAGWEAAPTGTPPSGTAGDMLIYTTEWAVLAKPTGTKILQNASGTFSWIDAPTGVPTGGSTSMVLQKASATNYAVEWDWVRSV